MTVHWHCFLVFSVLLLASGDSIQNSYSQIHNSQPCPCPYSCITTSQCAERHTGRGVEEVLFQCGRKGNVCCPPNRRSDPTRIDVRSGDIGDCSDSFSNPTTEDPFKIYEENRPEESQKPSGGKDYFLVPSGIYVHIEDSLKEQNKRPTEWITSHTSNMRSTEAPKRVHSESSNSRLTTEPPRWNNRNASNKRQTTNSRRVTTEVYYERPTTENPRITSQSYNFRQTTEIPKRVTSQSLFYRPSSVDSSKKVTSLSSKVQQGSNPQNSSPKTTVVRPPQKKSKPSLTSHKNFKLLPSEGNCGVNTFSNRITEGEEVSLGEYPWMVLTGLRDRYGNHRWNCGGTLINGRYVLTAAHCVVVDNRIIEYVRLGEHSLTNTTDCYRDVCLEAPEDVVIEEAIPHEKWNTTTIKNDIALLRLSKNVLNLGKSNIYPICLPTNIEKLNITTTTKYEVAGWGKTDWNADEGSDVLRKASLSGVSKEECNICKDKKKQQYCPITDTQLCVQGWKAVDVCKGDSGGPLMVTRFNIYQIGITSFKGSEYCGAENIPSIFTKIESYLPWILDHIRE